MARTVRDASLETRTARSRLAARGKPYYRTLEPGLHLGYRKPAGGGAGKWVARHYIGEQNYLVETIATADDFSDADGVAVLSFRQAQAKARERMVSMANAAAGKRGPLTVRDAVEDYLGFLETNRKSALDSRIGQVHIYPELGDLEVEALTTERLSKWHVDAAQGSSPPRTKPGRSSAIRTVGTTTRAVAGGVRPRTGS